MGHQRDDPLVLGLMGKYLFIDPSAGSKDLIAPLKAMRLPVRRKRVKFGDLHWTGERAGKTVSIGMEFKTLSDLLACIQDKRLVSHQIPGLVKSYDIRWLVIEGSIRPRRDGTLEELHSFRSRRGKEIGIWQRVYASITYRQAVKYVLTLAHKANFHVKWTSCRAESLAFIACEFSWWQTPWDKHHAHLALPAWEDNHPRVDAVLFRRPSVLRRVASCLPGIGWTRSSAVARRFKSMEAMVRATRKDWQSVEGLGKVTADKVWRAIRGEKVYSG
jgi:ERCC4-type nuclease